MEKSKTATEMGGLREERHDGSGSGQREQGIEGSGDGWWRRQ